MVTAAVVCHDRPSVVKKVFSDTPQKSPRWNQTFLCQNPPNAQKIRRIIDIFQMYSHNKGSGLFCYCVLSTGNWISTLALCAKQFFARAFYFIFGQVSFRSCQKRSKSWKVNKICALKWICIEKAKYCWKYFNLIDAVRV